MKTEIESTLEQYFKKHKYDCHEVSFHSLEGLPFTREEIAKEQIETENAEGYVMVCNRKMLVPHIVVTKKYIYMYKHSEALNTCVLHLYTVHKNESTI